MCSFYESTGDLFGKKRRGVPHDAEWRNICGVPALFIVLATAICRSLSLLKNLKVLLGGREQMSAGRRLPTLESTKSFRADPDILPSSLKLGTPKGEGRKKRHGGESRFPCVAAGFFRSGLMPCEAVESLTSPPRRLALSVATIPPLLQAFSAIASRRRGPENGVGALVRSHPVRRI